MRKTIVTAVASLTFLLAFTLTGCSNEGAHDSGVREIKDRSGYENVVELGPISARYADGMVVVRQYEPRESSASGDGPDYDHYTDTTVIFGDPDDYRLRFNLILCEGVGLDDVEAYAAVAEQQARDRVAALEEAAETSEHLGQSFENAAILSSRIEYAEPERVVINGSDGLVWYSTVPGDGNSFVNMTHIVEVDDDTIGVILAGYFQSEYERDPASWDDVLCTLSVK